MIDKNTAGGVINFKGLSKLIDNPTQRRTFEAVFNPTQRDAFRKFVQAGKLVTEKSQAGTGSFAIQQVGAVIAASGAVTGQGSLTATGAGILTLPVVLARVLANPSLTELMTKGLVAPPGSQKAAQLVTQLFLRLQKELSSEKKPNTILPRN